eukprot:gene7317-8096_t
MSSDIQAKPTSVNRPSRETILTAEAVKRAVQQGQLDEEKAKRIMDSWMDIEKEKNGTTDAATKDELFKKKLGTLFGPMKMKEYFELIIAGRAKVLDDVHKRRLERDEQARMQQQQQMQRQQLQQHQQQSTYQAHSINPSSQSAQNTLPNQSAKLQHPQSQMSGGEIPNYGSAPILQVQPPPISTIPSSSTQPHIQANVISKPTRPQVVNPPIYSPQMSNQNPASVGGPAASSFAPYNPTTLRPNPTTSAPTNYSFYAPSGTASTTVPLSAPLPSPALKQGNSLLPTQLTNSQSNPPYSSYPPNHQQQLQFQQQKHQQMQQQQAPYQQMQQPQQQIQQQTPYQQLQPQQTPYQQIQQPQQQQQQQQLQQQTPYQQVQQGSQQQMLYQQAQQGSQQQQMLQQAPYHPPQQQIQQQMQKQAPYQQAQAQQGPQLQQMQQQVQQQAPYQQMRQQSQQQQIQQQQQPNLHHQQFQQQQAQQHLQHQQLQQHQPQQRPIQQQAMQQLMQHQNSQAQQPLQQQFQQRQLQQQALQQQSAQQTKPQQLLPSILTPPVSSPPQELQVKREGEQKINNSFAKILDNKALAPVPQPEQTISANKYKEKSNGKEDSNASTDVVVVSSSTVNSATVKEEEQRPKAVPRTINSGVSAGTVNTLSSSNLSAASSTSALSQSWQYFHLVDRPMMQLGLASCVGGGGLKNMTPGAQQALSEALQLHFKYIIETGIRQTKRRNNLGTIDIYRGLLRSMVGRIGDKVGDDYSSTIGLKWGPPVAEILKQEEEQIAALCTETLQREEQTLKEQMMEYDEERAKVIGAKKKGGSSGDIEPPWWSQDDAAEKKGLLSWEQWVDVAQRAEIATRCQLGPGVNKRRRPGKEDGGHGANHSASALSSSSLADSRRVDGSSTEPESRFQLQKCPLKIENRSNVVSYDDVIAAISRYHASNNGGASSDKSLAEPLGRSIARWKLRSSHS